MYKSDFLVIGTGLAGLNFALNAAEHGSVLVVTKNEMMEANTRYAQGGIAGVMNLEEDSFENHISDTLIAGDGLCDKEAVELMVKSAPKLIQELIDYGVKFTDKEEILDLGREGGHSKKRIVHAADATGKEVETVMLARVKNHPNIKILEHHFVMDLLTEHHLGIKVKKLPEIQCFGAYVLDQKKEKVHRMLARITVLATGGIGQVYQYTTNPSIATGDGVSMAYRAKAKISNMEFVQFHPTSLNLSEAKSFLITEALRGFGGVLRNSDGHAFMEEYDHRKDLAPRDIIARAIDDQLKTRGDKSVFLDVTHLDGEAVKEEFPTIYSTCISFGIDITKDQIPVVPAAHYGCGGVVTDLYGQTSIKRLFACGEIASTGVHGANRLASNSLLEALYFSKAASQKAIEKFKDFEYQENITEWDISGTFNTKEWILISHNREELQQIMWDYVGIVRSDLRLQRALRRVTLLFEEVEDFYERTTISVPLCELRNLISVAYLIIKAAMSRTENRGLHYNTDHVNNDKAIIHD
tara:strand:- start:24917 stop:26491 length:1575 start_codon:yes stop_codon:yes gene_type:complete